MKGKNQVYMLAIGLFYGIFTGSCQKEENPSVKCFSPGWDIEFDSLHQPIDSIIYWLASEGEEYSFERRYRRYNIDSSSTNLAVLKVCGLFRYRMEIYNSAANPEIRITLKADGHPFKKASVKGITVVEGTYIW